MTNGFQVFTVCTQSMTIDVKSETETTRIIKFWTIFYGFESLPFCPCVLKLSKFFLMHFQAKENCEQESKISRDTERMESQN